MFRHGTAHSGPKLLALTAETLKLASAQRMVTLGVLGGRADRNRLQDGDKNIRMDPNNKNQNPANMATKAPKQHRRSHAWKALQPARDRVGGSLQVQPARGRVVGGSL